ncbi:superoxide dismutase family protein [Bacillus sp. FJAT-47783]|uniref:superoxide dismutase family protein n=1 Tax=Bacillus sp. FJAT-47783 TaxID=2922712 RepID=UPI001FAE160C|nr:superoxide dismutase family protein [Bacillus sp. FJAT-47783]
MRIKKWILFISVMMLTGCTADDLTKLSVEMFNPEGDSLGTIEIMEEADGLGLTVLLEGLPPGEHGFHIHEKGECTPPDFSSAGNHFNPDEKKHGLLHPEGAHAGDLQNITADENGMVDHELKAPNLTLKKGEKNSLLQKDGTAIIVTEGKDDGMSQPSGDSGKRIACGEITEDEAKRKDKNEVEKEEDK